MRRRFFVDQVRNGHAEISGEDARHLTRVLRVEVGQRYELSDNHNVYLAEVEMARKEHVAFRTLEKLIAEPLPVDITLYAALIKFDSFEWMIEKTTELGVSKIVPVITIRTEHGLEKAAHKRLERWQRIALEASQQSRRAYLPEIGLPVRLRDVFRDGLKKDASTDGRQDIFNDDSEEAPEIDASGSFAKNERANARNSAGNDLAKNFAKNLAKNVAKSDIEIDEESHARDGAENREIDREASRPESGEASRAESGAKGRQVSRDPRNEVRRYVLDENPGGPPLLSMLPLRREASDSIALLIGPEGGWTEEERAGFLAAEWTPVTLGPTILRAETAAIAATSVLVAAWLKSPVATLEG